MISFMGICVSVQSCGFNKNISPIFSSCLFTTDPLRRDYYEPISWKANPMKLSFLSSFFHPQENKEPPAAQFPAGSTLGVEVCKVHRRFSGNLQLPPLSWRQAEKERDRGRSLTPEEDPVTRTRPTSLPIVSLPRIDITQADPDR